MIEISLDASAWKDVETGVEALVDRWQVAEGDMVRAGQSVANVVIVKASMDIVAPADGRIDRILVHDGETFAPGQPIGLLKEAT